MPVIVFPPACAGVQWSAIAGDPYDNAALGLALDKPREVVREISFQKRGSVSADPSPDGTFLPFIIASNCRIEAVYHKLESGSAVCSLYVNGYPAESFLNFSVATVLNSTSGELELNEGDLLGVKVESVSGEPTDLNISIKIISQAEVAR